MSTPAKHTAGPWLAASHASSIVGWPIVGHQGRSIAAIHYLPHRPEGVSDAIWAEYTAECKANAHLIAAAPDLLAALLALIPEGWGDDDTMDHMPGVKLARLAIAKALATPVLEREGK